MKTLIAVAKVLIRIYYAIVYRPSFPGMENVPSEGAFILCSNHVAFRDPFLLILHVRRRIHFMAKKELFKGKFLTAALKAGDAFPVDRGHADLSAIRESMRVLKEGDALGIFPQGTRSGENDHIPMHSGTAMIALRSGAPVVPAFINGPYRPFRRLVITIGKPIPAAELGAKCDSETIAAATEKIDQAIWKLKQD